MIIRERYSGNTYSQLFQTLPIKQVYGRLHTKDDEIIVVSKDGVQRQLPGGKPEKGEKEREALEREVKEETGISIQGLYAKCFGYYYVHENKEEYLQLRYYIQIEKNNLKLMPSEKDDIVVAEYIPLHSITEYINWLFDNPELKTFCDYKDIVI